MCIHSSLLMFHSLVCVGKYFSILLHFSIVDNVIHISPNKIICLYMVKVLDGCVCRIEASVILLLEELLHRLLKDRKVF